MNLLLLSPSQNFNPASHSEYVFAREIHSYHYSTVILRGGDFGRGGGRQWSILALIRKTCSISRRMEVIRHSSHNVTREHQPIRARVSGLACREIHFPNGVIFEMLFFSQVRTI